MEKNTKRSGTPEGFRESLKKATTEMLVLFLLGYLIQGMAEELLYRSYLMVTIARRYSMTVAVLISAVIGALPYAAGAVEAPLAFLNGMLFGIFAALYLIRRGNIWGIGAFHAAWSFVRDIVFGTPDQEATVVVLLVGMILVGGKRNPAADFPAASRSDTGGQHRFDPEGRT